MKVDNETHMLSRLTFNKINILNWFERGILPLVALDNRLGIAISYFKIISLHNNILYGAFSLKNAWQKEAKDLYDEIASFPMFYRTMHLQNAFVTYNSCIDYVYQVLYFYYDLDSCVNNVRTHKEVLDLEKQVKAYRRNSFDEIIKTHNLNVYKAIKVFRTEVKGLNTKANNIKHDAGFWIEGNHIETFGNASIDINGENINLTNIITPRCSSISEDIEFLVHVHNSFVRFEKVLFEQLDFRGKLK